MPITNLLVAYNGTDTAKAALRLACLVARTNDAHLTGLFAHALPHYHAQVEPYMAPDTIAMLTRHETEAEERVTREFRELCAAEGMTGRVDFHSVSGQPNDLCAEFARTHDLAVIGQAEGDFWELYREPHPDTVAFQSGRGVLVAPRDFAATALPEDAVVAWDGGRACARALAEAMALLKAFKNLLVLHVGEDESAIRRPGRDIMEHLGRHGIKAELRVEPRAGRTIGETIMQTCDTLDAGLLIMGAYEHSRFTETLFGGATKDIVARARCPVLMAH